MRLSGSDSLGLELSGPVADKNGLVLLCDLGDSFIHSWRFNRFARAPNKSSRLCVFNNGRRWVHCLGNK